MLGADARDRAEELGAVRKGAWECSEGNLTPADASSDQSMDGALFAHLDVVSNVA